MKPQSPINRKTRFEFAGKKWLLGGCFLSIAAATLLVQHSRWGHKAAPVSQKDMSFQQTAQGSLASGDPTVRPITWQKLHPRLTQTAISSPQNDRLLEQAANSHLLQEAYNFYSLRYQRNPHGFYENLWCGKAAYLLNDFKTNGDDEKSHLLTVSKHRLENAVKLKPHSALANACLGHFAFRYGFQYYEDCFHYGANLMKQGVQDDPNCALAHRYLGDMYSDNLHDGPWYNSVKGEQEYLSAMKLEPDSWYLHFHLLIVATTNQDKQTALKALNHLDTLIIGNASISDDIAKYRQYTGSMPNKQPGT